MTEGTTRTLWVLAGIILFGFGIGLQNLYMFIGGMFLLVLTASVRFPNDRKEE